jgi:hypothetical protein
MAVTVIDRPAVVSLSTEMIEAFAFEQPFGVTIQKTAHGLIDGNVVYIESNIGSYNGFVSVIKIDNNNFYIQVNDEYIPFKQEADIVYYKGLSPVFWQCVHLPIVYELESDLYPINSVDTVITITPYGDVNGYFAVTHSALTGADELFALDYVKLADGRVLQVVEIVSSTITVLNFDGSGSISTMQKVRNNYHIDVNVYAGLPAGHTWEDEKPYELATTLRFIPDSDNQIKFSIAEILKGYINTRNNLTLDTLPNNIDFFTAFYIEYAEGYDVSNGTEITAFLDEFTDDSEEFHGYAVNAMLPFKNLYSGYMGEYIDSTEVLARWLTTMDTPIILVGYFFDLSFINTHEGDIEIFKNGVLYLTITDPGIGILRVPIEAQNGDDQLCIQAKSGSDFITELICLQVVSECNTFIADDLRLIETGPFRELE